MNNNYNPNNNYNHQNSYNQSPPQYNNYNNQNSYNQAPPQYNNYNKQNGYNQPPQYGYNQGYNNYNNDPATFEQRRINAYKTLIDKEKVAFIIWLVIGIVQCITLVAVFAGAWNIYCAIQTNNRCKSLESYPRGVCEMYDRQQTNLIIALVINLLVGGCIGIAGVIYDFITRDYVLKNREYFQ
ncbi:MAG: hypothetical protein IJ289_08820 [Clostridia bacterium]|nr:hypothetical protein [Clostridia bacterium]